MLGTHLKIKTNSIEGCFTGFLITQKPVKCPSIDFVLVFQLGTLCMEGQGNSTHFEFCGSATVGRTSAIFLQFLLPWEIFYSINLGKKCDAGQNMKGRGSLLTHPLAHLGLPHKKLNCLY